MLCHYCEGLTVAKLFAIAKKEIEKYAPRHWRCRHEDSDMRENVIFPQDNLYPHQPSYSLLQESADVGCGICKVIYDHCEKDWTHLLDPDGSKWPSTGDMFRHYEANGIPTDIKIAIDSHNLSWKNNEELDITVLDTFMAQVGHHQNFLNKPSLRLDLTVPRGSYYLLCVNKNHH
jgi:hypothetical protein